MSGLSSERARLNDGDDTALEEPVTALIPYLRSIRSHWRLVAILTGATLLACFALLQQRSLSYDAQAQILVTPLVPGDQSFVGLPIVRTSPGDPTRTVATVAGVIDSPKVVERTARSVPTSTPDEIDASVTVEPEEGSNVININARTDDPELAALIASKYAKAALEVRKAELQPLIEVQVDRAERQLNSISDPSGSPAEAVRSRLRALATIRDGSDPTLSIANIATVPKSPVDKPAWLILILAGIGGLTIGAGTVVLSRLLSGHLVEDDDALFAMLELPVFARVPVVQSSLLGRARVPTPVESAAAFRLLRAQLEMRGRGRGDDRAGGPRGVTALVGATPGDGTTSSVFALARTCITNGLDVIVVERSAEGLPLTRLLPVADQPGLRLVTTGPLSESAPDQRGRSKLRDVVEAARNAAECVIVDLGAAGDVGEALTVLDEADHVVVVVRFGHTQSHHLDIAAELIEQGAVTDRAGFFVLGSGEAEGVVIDPGLPSGRRSRPKAAVDENKAEEALRP
ncbi:MAG: hypothetical protein ABIZ50_04485 [Solirubrobacterales bacterium]